MCRLWQTQTEIGLELILKETFEYLYIPSKAFGEEMRHLLAEKKAIYGTYMVHLTFFLGIKLFCLSR